MIPARSLRRELAIRLTLGLLGFWLLAIVAAGFLLRHEMETVFDSALQETGERILPLAVMELMVLQSQDDDEEGRLAQPIMPIVTDQEYLTYVVRSRTGRVLLYSHDADLGIFSAPLREGLSSTLTHRIYARSAVSGAYTIQVAEPLLHRREALFEAVVALMLPLALLMPLSVVGVGLFLRRGLRPLTDLSQEVRARDAQDLSPLPATNLKAEIAPIRDAVNRLMARLSRSLEAERAFSANAAHEMRTPIAASLAQAQRLVAETPDGPLRVRARAVEAELKRLARLSEKLMQLARAEGGGILTETPVDLVPILQAVLADLPPGHPIVLRLPRAGHLMSRLDPDVFAILSRNLIENALNHGTSDAPVEVALHDDGRLQVTNDCPVIAPEVLARLTTRFERAGARGPGSGLGLAIATGIAHGMGRELHLQSPAPGRERGFAVDLQIG